MNVLVEIFGINSSYIEDYINCKDQDNFSFGLSSSSFNRFIIFQEFNPDTIHFIDFRECNIQRNQCYFIPAHHFYYLDFDISLEFFCLSFPPWIFDPKCRMFFWELKYSLDKAIYFDSAINSSELLRNASEGLSLIFRQMYHIVLGKNVVSDFRKLSKMDQFIDLLTQNTLNYNNLYISYFSRKLYMSERNFRRLCREIFKKPPLDIIKFHLVNQVANYLIKKSDFNLSDVAIEFGFLHESSILRLLRENLNLNSQILRNKFSHH